MKYEQISKNCKIRWVNNFEFKNSIYRQVSGYIFDDENRMLIVKVKGDWTIPGGHPEAGENSIDTLNREIYEEAMVKIKNIKYIGAVEVIENGEKYYQLRYIAKVDKICEFKKEFESSERKFVELSLLKNYIKWYEGITFLEQIKSATEGLKE